MLVDKLEERALEYKAEGMEKGIEKGEMLALQKLLSKRFGPIASEITAKTSIATLEQIESWFDRAIDANQLSVVFDC
jgi:hypothetical protein